MQFGNISQFDCINVPPPADSRCFDPAFALANPALCPTEPQLVIKPAVALACALGGIQFKAFYVTNGQELDVTSSTSFVSSNTDVAVIGAQSGNATGLSAGDSTIAATYQGKTAFADFTVLGDGCCDEQQVAIMVVVDRSKSMSQQFNGSYSTKLVYAKAAASQFISEVNESKDTVGLLQFTATSNELLSPPIADKDAVQALVPGIVQTSQLTTFYNALTTAVAALADVTADRKLLLIISDGEDTDASYSDGDNPIDLIAEFRTQGGIVMALGVRAHDRGYALLGALATGGFFINAHDDTAAAALDYISGLKGYVCAGNCVPTGDEFAPSGSLNYCGFDNWQVADGHVDLIGNGFMDLLPGNGLYVDLAGSSPVYKGTMITRDSLALEASKTYRLTARIAGNQRVNSPPNSVRLRVFSRNSDAIPNQDLSSAPVLTDGAGSAPVETYEYAFSYMNEYGETMLTPAVSITNGGFETFNIAVTSDAPLSVVGVVSLLRLWKREQGTDTWYLIAEGDPSSATITDTLNNDRLASLIANGSVNLCDQPVSANTTGTPIYLLDQLVQINNWQQGFSDIAYTFVSPGDANVYISIQQIDTPAGYDQVGLLLDSATFVNVTDLTTMFEDNFNDENLQYIPPACGIGGSYVIIGNQPGELTSLVPEMTTNTEPSGVVTSNSTSGAQAPESLYYPFDGTHANSWFGDCGLDQYLQYQFPTAKRVAYYEMATRISGESQNGPSDWILEGSNNGTTWTEIDSRTGETWTDGTGRMFAVASPDLYVYYRLTISACAGGAVSVSILWLELFSGGVGDPIYGYETSYNCYGQGCLTTPPVAQVPDPNPLPDIEQGYVPPQSYTSTKTVCVSCPAGFINGSDANLVPVMTSDTAPSGAASANEDFPTHEAFHAFDGNDTTFWQAGNSGSNGGWLRYQLATAKTIAAYEVCTRNGTGPGNWTFEGSNNGSAWTVLDTQIGTTWPSPLSCKRFAIEAPGSYLYYRINVTAIAQVSTSDVRIYAMSMFGALTPTVCGTGSGASEISQGDADTQAMTAAAAAANAQLNCQQVFSATITHTAHCPVGSFGASASASATALSFVSQADANALALAEAQAVAEAALVCDLSNNDEQITINSGAGATATPYPSTEYIADSVTISKVVVNILDLSHTYSEDVNLVLVSPAGTMVSIMRHCGGNNAATNLDFIFDDAAGSFLPDATALSAGTFKPSTYGTNSFPPAPAPQSVPLTTLAAFIGEDSQGAWSLWVFDSLGGGGGTIASWNLTISV